MSRRPRDERDTLNLPKKPTPPKVHERTTVKSDGSSGALERIGKGFEGADGKRYMGSVALHVYEVKKILSTEYIFAVHSTDIRHIPETVMVEGVGEIGGALMERYGHKRPAKTTDKDIKISEHKVT